MRRWSREPLEVGEGVAGQLVGTAGEQHIDLATPVAQQPRRHQAIAAIVALTGDYDDRTDRGELGGEAGETRPGALHQLERRNAAVVDRPGVDRPHPFGIGQRLKPVR